MNRTKTAIHYICPQCGCQQHHRGRCARCKAENRHLPTCCSNCGKDIWYDYDPDDDFPLCEDCAERMIHKHYFDEQEDAWFLVNEETAKEEILRYYLDWEPILEELEAGYIIYTDVAEYRMIQPGKGG